MAESESLKNHLLIAMPSLRDPNFSGTVVYIVGHDEQGARGFVVNRRTALRLSDVLERSKIPLEDPSRLEDFVYVGGPVSPERGAVLHEPAGKYMLSENVADGVTLTLSRDVLGDLGRGKGPGKRIFLLGYAGWLPGQLEAEIATGSWLTVPATPGLLFDVPPEDRLDRALSLLGISRAQLEAAEWQAGHA